jgi:hypothetical protein
MKRVTMLFTLLLTVASVLATAQDKATISSLRIKAKPGKEAELKKAITDHATKYHTGNWKWRVFEVLSGPDQGSYMINEGPNSWTTLEGRGEISDEHQRDFRTNVVPLLLNDGTELYLTYQRELSSDSAVGQLKKGLLRHLYLKPGKGPRMVENLKTWKKVWEKLGLRIVVWASFYSGQPQLVIASRLTNGWTDLERPIGKELRDAFDEIKGPGAYARYLEDLDSIVDHISEEMIEYLPDASSK